MATSLAPLYASRANTSENFLNAELADLARRSSLVRSGTSRAVAGEFIAVLADRRAVWGRCTTSGITVGRAIDVVDLEPGLWMSLSISAGVAVFPDNEEAQEQLLAASDSRIYQAKFSPHDSANSASLTSPAPQFAALKGPLYEFVEQLQSHPCPQPSVPRRGTIVASHISC